MEIRLLAVGKTQSRPIKEIFEGYVKRIRHYIPFSFSVIPDIKNAGKLPEIRQKELEGKEILSSVMPSDKLILLDENGKMFTSQEFSEFLTRHMLSGLKRLVFVIGGPYGFSPEVYAKADARISLSKMTFNHEMVRIFFTEQLYRAMTIIRGESYHHA